jgi:hypothetical protein
MMMANIHIGKLITKAFPTIPGEQNKPAWEFVPYTPGYTKV